MVLQDTIDNLRERPHRDRHTIALGISVAVVVLLLIGWAFFFFRSLNVGDMQEIQETYDQVVQDATPPADVTGWVSEAPKTVRTTNSETNGDVQLIEEVSATSTIDSQ
jgi:hypothetical protein